MPQTINLKSTFSTLNHQPSTLSPQPSTLNPQPSTIGPQPSTPTRNSQPSATLTPKPSTLNPRVRRSFSCGSFKAKRHPLEAYGSAIDSYKIDRLSRYPLSRHRCLSFPDFWGSFEEPFTLSSITICTRIDQMDRFSKELVAAKWYTPHPQI